MPKHEALTPKAIANRIKAKGLQKLRWYCQMCQKQCRDENGFKCHTMSESHQRQLLLFAENPDKYIDSFSKEFLDTFIELLQRRFGTKRVHANQVYQEYITDRHHTHMNSTQWETLTEFVKWLGREGHCIVDQTEKGWFISYIDRDPETIQRQEALAKKEKLDMDDSERMAKFIEQQVERAKAKGQNSKSSIYTELKKESEDEKVAFALSAAKEAKLERKVEKNPLEMPRPFKDTDHTGARKKTPKATDDARKTSKRSALDELMKEQEMLREKKNRKDYWLCPGIVVKVKAEKLGEKYYKKKGVVKDVKDLYVGIIKMLDSGDVLKLDQAHLETVIPSIGRPVRVVNGAYRGCDGILESVNLDKYCTSVKISSGVLRGRIVNGLPYEDISKIHTS